MVDNRRLVQVSLLVVIVLGIGFLAVSNSGLFNVSATVGDCSNCDEYQSLFAAEVACENRADDFEARYDRVCEPCGLACPSSAQDGSYDWDGDGTDDISFDSSLCSDRYTATGNLLEYKAYCGSTIRLCEEQVGTGTVVGTSSVSGGTISEIEYEYVVTDCSGTQLSDGGTNTVYQLSCDSGYVLSGTRQSSSSGGLGSCVLEEEQEQIAQEMSASFSSVSPPSSAEAGREARITGVVNVDGVSGNYYVHGEITEGGSNGGLLSVVSAQGFQDLCGSDPQAATIIKYLESGDQLSFVLSIPLPDQSTETKTYDYSVTVSSGCSATQYDTITGSFEVTAPFDDTVDEVVSAPIGNDTNPSKEELRESADSVIGQECFAGEFQTAANCQTAECGSDGTFVALEPAICYDSEGNANEVSTDRNVDSTTGEPITDEPSQTTKDRGWLGKFLCRILVFFGGQCL